MLSFGGWSALLSSVGGHCGGRHPPCQFTPLGGMNNSKISVMMGPGAVTKGSIGIHYHGITNLWKGVWNGK